MRVKRLIQSLLAVFCLMLPMAAGAADGVLQVELNKALGRSDAIAAARQSVRSATEQVGVAQSSLDLSSSLSASGAAVQSTTNDGRDRGFTRADNANLTLSVKKPLYDGGLATAESSLALLNVDRARIGFARAEQDVLQQALSAFVNLVAARDRVALEAANVARLEEYLKATQVRVDVGEATPTDLAATKARLARARASLITAEADRANASETYESLIGVPPPKMPLPTLPVAALPASVIAAGDAALTSALGHRLVILDQQEALSNLEILTARVRPNIDFEVRGRTTEADGAMRYDNDEVSANLTFSMPLFATGAVRSSARAAVANHRSAVFAESDSRRTTRLNAENAQRRFMAQEAVISAHEAELEAAVLFRDGTRAEADFGLKTILDVLDAEQDVVSAEVSLLLARRDRINAGIDVLAAIGRLNAATLGLSGEALADDTAAIPLPIRPRPLPTLIYPE